MQLYKLSSRFLFNTIKIIYFHLEPETKDYNNTFVEINLLICTYTGKNQYNMYTHFSKYGSILLS